jgi:hypothetical protein
MLSTKAFAAICCLGSAFLALNLPAQPATVRLTIIVTDPAGVVIPGQFSGVTIVAEVKLAQPSDSARSTIFASRNAQLTV